MRELKFRAWDKWRKSWIYGTDKTPFSIIGEITVFDMIKQYSIKDYNNIEIQQHTGLKDKNGKEIYEGDIVRYTYISGFNAEEDYREGADNLGNETQCVGSVEFENGEFTPRPDGSYPADGFYAWRTWDFEVIGNIYENPELLKESR